MLDLHALTDTTGNVALTLLSTAAKIPANDGQTAPGVPIAPGAKLKGWGIYTTIADTIAEAKLLSQDQIDSINGEYYNPGAASVLGIVHFESVLVYKTGGRLLYYKQNTGAAPVIGYLLDQYGTNGVPQEINNNIKLPQVFGGALTANTWGSVAVSPTSQIPAGKYAILGVYVHALTNYALIRFAHADFGGKKPGFPVVDVSKAAARAVLPPQDPVWNLVGRQFVALGDVPVFAATSAGTGLTIEMLSITADTPNVILNLVKVG